MTYVIVMCGLAVLGFTALHRVDRTVRRVDAKLDVLLGYFDLTIDSPVQGGIVRVVQDLVRNGHRKEAIEAVVANNGWSHENAELFVDAIGRIVSRSDHSSNR